MAISYSQFHTYQVCPRQYEYASIKKLPRGINIYESFGSSVHNCLKRWGELEMKTPFDLTHGKKGIGQSTKGNNQLGMFEEKQEEEYQILSVECLIDLWHKSFIVNTYTRRIEADFDRKRGEKLMRKFYEWWSLENRDVVGIEKSFKIEVGNIKINGRIDRIEKIQKGQNTELRVIDYKTSSPRTQKETDADLQLSIYAMAVKELFDVPCVEFILLFLSEDDVIEIATKRNEGQIKDAVKQIQILSEGIGSNEFRPTPSVRTCKRCPYKGVCDVSAVTQ